jgi:hypothetical protein
MECFFWGNLNPCLWVIVTNIWLIINYFPISFKAKKIFLWWHIMVCSIFMLSAITWRQSLPIYRKTFLRSRNTNFSEGRFWTTGDSSWKSSVLVTVTVCHIPFNLCPILCRDYWLHRGEMLIPILPSNPPSWVLQWNVHTEAEPQRWTSEKGIILN